MYLIFDCALFYARNAQYKNDVLNIINSPEIKGLIEHLKKFIDRNDIKDLMVFIEDKYKMKMNMNWSWLSNYPIIKKYDINNITNHLLPNIKANSSLLRSTKAN